jgi:hypothetical protein
LGLTLSLGRTVVDAWTVDPIFSALLLLDGTLRALRLPFATLLLPGSPFGALGLAFTALLLTLPLSVGAIAALRQLNSLARRLRGGGGNGGQDRRSDQQPSKHLFHLAILQLMSR